MKPPLKTQTGKMRPGLMYRRHLVGAPTVPVGPAVERMPDGWCVVWRDAGIVSRRIDGFATEQDAERFIRASFQNNQAVGV